MFSKKGVLKDFAKFTGTQWYQDLSFKKVAGLRSVNYSKKKLWHGCFLVNFVKILKAPSLINIFGGCFWIWSYKNYANTNTSDKIFK